MANSVELMSAVKYCFFLLLKKRAEIGMLIAQSGVTALEEQLKHLA